MSDDVRAQIQAEIVALCRKRSWTQTDLARASGVTIPTARSILGGGRPRMSTLRRVAGRIVDAAAQRKPVPKRPPVVRRPDLHAARYSVRRLAEVPMRCEGRYWLADVARQLGMGEDWAERPVRDYEAR